MSTIGAIMNTADILQTLKPKDFDAGIVFSGQPSGTKVRGYEKPCLFTPKINPSYIFHEASRDVIVWLISPPSPLYIYGACGTGKSSCICQLAARLNYPVFEVTGHNRLEFQDLAGHHTVQNGSMKFEYGPLALAMKYGGLSLLNELDLLEPSTATGLNGILDGQPLSIPENGGEIIEPHPMFRFAATANTNGANDDTGLYQGTLRMNMALMDRFTVLEMNYPKPEAEMLVLEKAAPGLPGKILKKMIELANEVRRLFMGENGYGADSIEITFSTRTLLRWADLTMRYQPLASQGIQPIVYALDRALGFRASRETRAMLHELTQRIFSVDKLGEGLDAGYSKTQELASPSKRPAGFSSKLLVHTLDPLIQEAARSSKQLSFEPQISLECQTGSGGKFWKANATRNTLTLSWGKIGTIGSSKTLNRSECSQNNPVLELRNRALIKLGRGYDIIPAQTRLP